MQSNYISTNHSKHYLKAHIILVTKYRKPLLVNQLKEDMYVIFNNIIDNSDFTVEVLPLYYYTIVLLYHWFNVYCLLYINIYVMKLKISFLRLSCREDYCLWKVRKNVAPLTPQRIREREFFLPTVIKIIA